MRVFCSKKINFTSALCDDHDLRVVVDFRVSAFSDLLAAAAVAAVAIYLSWLDADVLLLFVVILLLYPLHVVLPPLLFNFFFLELVLAIVSVTFCVCKNFLYIFGDFHFCCSMCFLSSSRQTTRLSVRFVAINPDLIVSICQAPNGTDFGHQFVWNAEVPCRNGKGSICRHRF